MTLKEMLEDLYEDELAIIQSSFQVVPAPVECPHCFRVSNASDCFDEMSEFRCPYCKTLL